MYLNDGMVRLDFGGTGISSLGRHGRVTIWHGAVYETLQTSAQGRAEDLMRIS